MKIQQSIADENLFFFTHNKAEIAINILKATPTSMSAYITINKSILGKHNILEASSLGKAFKEYQTRNGRWSEHFESENVFKDVMLNVAQKLRNGEHEIEKHGDKGIDEEKVLDEKNIKFLSQKDLLDLCDNILRHSHKEPFAFLHRELMVSFLSILSCKTEFPLSLEIVGGSSSSKTYTALRAANGLPKDMVVILAGASKEALKYEVSHTDEEGNRVVVVDERCLIVLEKEDSKEFVKKLKPLMSHDREELLYKVPVKNQITGESETQNYLVKGSPSVITITVRDPKDIEEITRRLLLTPDTSPQTIDGVITALFERATKPSRKIKIHPDLGLLQDTLGKIKKYHVINVFADMLNEIFPRDVTQRYRDVKKLLALVETITALHQLQRVKYGDTDIFATLEDNLLALILFDTLMKETFTGIPSNTMRIYEYLIDMDDKGTLLTIDNVVNYLHAKHVKLGRQEVKQKLDNLHEHGLLDVLVKGAGSKKRTYGISEIKKSLLDFGGGLTLLLFEKAIKNIDNIFMRHKEVLYDEKGHTYPEHVGECVLPRHMETLPRIARSLLNFNYLSKDNKRGVFWKISNDEQRKALFTLDNPLLVVTHEKTKEFEERKKRKAEIEDAIIDGMADDETWLDSFRKQQDELVKTKK